MRVGYVLKRYPRYSETFIVNEILAHEEAGLEVAIFALRPPSDTHFQDAIARVRAPVRYIPGKPASTTALWEALRQARAAAPSPLDLDDLLDSDVGTVSQAMQLALAVREAGITHLHAHFATLATSVARLSGAMTGRPYTFTAHAKDLYHEDVSQDDLRRKVSGASAVVTVSEYNLAHLFGVCPEAGERIHRVYNGMDLERFTYQAPERRAPRILGIGRLVEKKGFDVLIDACAELVRRGVTFECRIIGHGELEEALRERVVGLRLTDVVKLTGPRPQGEVIGELQGAAAMAAPCVIGADGNRDGLPTTILESMALGTPVVSTDVTGIPEVVREGETGRLVGQHDVPALADALQEMLVDADQRVRLARNARTLIDGEFDVRKNTGRLRELFAAAADA